jgi:hypothetical protein
MKKITKVLLIAGAVDVFYGHFYAIWRNVSPESFDWFFEQKDNLYKGIGLDKLWKKTED